MKKVILFIFIITLASYLFVYFNNQEDVGVLDQKTSYKDLIEVDIPKPEASVTSPLVVEGRARGNWYFEASFPVEVLDEDGSSLGIGIAEAQGEWMTVEFVPFSGKVVFSKPKGSEGTVVFRKDNPSGLPENDDSVSIPVIFR